MSRRAQVTLHSQTECSGQTLCDRRVWKRAAAGRSANTISTANMSEDINGIESLRGTATSAYGSAICEMSSCTAKRRSLT